MYKVKIEFEGTNVIVQAKDVDAYGLHGVSVKTQDGEYLPINLDEIEELAYDIIYDLKYNRELE